VAKIRKDRGWKTSSVAEEESTPNHDSGIGCDTEQTPPLNTQNESAKKEEFNEIRTETIAKVVNGVNTWDVIKGDMDRTMGVRTTSRTGDRSEPEGKSVAVSNIPASATTCSPPKEVTVCCEESNEDPIESEGSENPESERTMLRYAGTQNPFMLMKEPTEQLEKEMHTRSVVNVGDTLSYCEPEHVVSALHTRSVVAVADVLSYSVTVHVVSVLHTRSVVAVANVLSY
jgi:hypothetical protein